MSFPPSHHQSSNALLFCCPTAPPVLPAQLHERVLVVAAFRRGEGHRHARDHLAPRRRRGGTPSQTLTLTRTFSQDLWLSEANRSPAFSSDRIFANFRFPGGRAGQPRDFRGARDPDPAEDHGHGQGGPHVQARGAVAHNGVGCLTDGGLRLSELASSELWLAKQRIPVLAKDFLHEGPQLLFASGEHHLERCQAEFVFLPTHFLFLSRLACCGLVAALPCVERGRIMTGMIYKRNSSKETGGRGLFFSTDSEVD